MKLTLKLLLFIFLCNAYLWAADVASPWYTQDEHQKVRLNVELFLSSTCPHCQKADAFFKAIASEHPDLQIQRNVINEDKNALFRFNQLLSEQHLDDFSVPSIYFCDSRWLGFASEDSTGKDLLHAMSYCKQEIEKNGRLTQATVDTLRHWANANKFNSGMIDNPSALNYIVTIALTDAFSPCALFCFAGFLALLFIEKQRKKQIIAAVLFILSLGLVHYMQQAHTNSFYILLPWMRLPALGFGLFVLYWLRHDRQHDAHHRQYFLLAILLGLITSFYQQTCVMNWSYIFEQWLHNQDSIGMQADFYQLLYQLIYVVPLLIILMVYPFLGRRTEKWEMRLSQIGFLFLSAIALCLIFYPSILSSFSLSLVLVVVLFVWGCFFKGA